MTGVQTCALPISAMETLKLQDYEDIVNETRYVSATSPSVPFYHNSESVEMGGFSGRFPTFRIYGTGGHLGVDLS